MKFLVIGHPRSGTAYMADLLSAYGYPVGHNEMRKEGIAAPRWGLRSNPLPGSSINRNDYEFEHTIMVVRDPIKVIASTFRTCAEKEYLKHYAAPLGPMIEQPDFLSVVVKTVAVWHEVMKPQASLIVKLDDPVEDAPEAVRQYLANRNMPVEEGTLPPSDVNSHTYVPMNATEIREVCSSDAWASLQVHAENYRYFL